MRPPRSVESSRRSHWHQEALLEKARREEVDVSTVHEEVCCPIRLESAYEDLWFQRVPMRDTFITHRAFCDALAHESARAQPPTHATISNSDQPVQQSFLIEEPVLH
ncbi:hypothetical protein L2E82_39840 [Cichorium intybus]|uniref:Uncharacterized protein n=1 Tax=Cichorium intybus TaxID=13427 RepID=A0ACB9AJM7_CICIN|nr:hypothetical protein L2E82_39840 [Cichorium intybus]